MNATQAHATVPIGTAHFPSENGPGLNLFRPEVMRRNTGATYERYKPITADLDSVRS